ncbi:hypothetical protein P5V15_004341 [Pogonomyrmex californicus]
MWAANSSLTFERDSMNPDIMISFQEGFHMFIDIAVAEYVPRCWTDPVTYFISLHYRSSRFPSVVRVLEVHVDNSEKWHTELIDNLINIFYLLYTLTHEIGYALGLHHSPQKDSIMYAFLSSKTFPVRLSEVDFLAIQNLYDLKNKNEVSKPSVPTMTTMTTYDRDDSTDVDLYVLRRVDAVLVGQHKQQTVVIDGLSAFSSQ